MTEVILENYPELKPLVDKYDLKFDLDQFGYGKCIFHKRKEIGYFFESKNGISLVFVSSLGVENKLCSDWDELIKRVEFVLGEVE